MIANSHSGAKMDTPGIIHKLHDFLYQERTEGPVVKLVLRHVTAGGQSSKDGEVFSVNIPHTEDCVTIDEGELSTLVTDIETAAHDDAEGLAAGVQRYKLLIYCKHQSHPFRRIAFRMSAGHDEEDEIGLTEGPNPKGLLGQMMRHNEALMRTAVMGANQTIGMLVRQNSSQANQMEILLRDRRADYETMEELKSQHHERDLMSMESENREKRFQMMFEKASILVPALVNRVSGQKLLPESSTPFREMVRGLVESMDGDQLGKIMPHLRSDQQLAFMEIFESMRQEEQGKQKTNGKPPALTQGKQ